MVVTAITHWALPVGHAPPCSKSFICVNQSSTTMCQASWCHSCYLDQETETGQTKWPTPILRVSRIVGAGDSLNECMNECVGQSQKSCVLARSHSTPSSSRPSPRPTCRTWGQVGAPRQGINSFLPETQPVACSRPESPQGTLSRSDVWANHVGTLGGAQESAFWQIL